ncbi:GntR family transcriptional regulator [Novosphingobium sp. GV055]|nr:GntR family transcriptional regulator [Novosphingobium sp. BK256]MBB3377410.1 GntR family transcriptional regulator [Novosphingobium sp. BK258]MBB3554842.1 GntR family transcriptional regulator [Novosphingobium sp. BK349]MBB3596431.1 GntR family transcriptional regulator [Novosphingobium sp. BK540]MBB3650893.1 GntR family transcriptional regulator [Novosphingobium sp. BK626]PTR12376.1 GntR family transcriptional regulator [Novosphingobium sp. GV055]PUB05777.1 GntR family transcriptional re
MMSFVQRVGRLREDLRAPLYLQLQQLVRQAIETKVLTQDDMIPAERDLALEYGVSRITVRKAIDGLAQEGLVVRRRGSGTYVAARVEKSFSKLSSFSEDMLARGRKPSSEWLSRSAGLVTPEESLSLGLSPGRQVYRFQRLRFADDVPMAFETSTIAADCLAGIDAVKDSLYAALEAEGNRPVRALQRLRAMPFPGEQARRLGVETGHAGLLIERRGFLGDGRAVEYTQSYYRGDAYDVVAELNAG